RTFRDSLRGRPGRVRGRSDHDVHGARNAAAEGRRSSGRGLHGALRSRREAIFMTGFDRQAQNGSASSPGAVLITGGSGFLGSLAAAAALAESDATVMLPIREPHTRESVLAPIAAELAAEGRAM